MTEPVLRALLFTDVVDSTQWVQQLGDEAALARWSAHDRAARELLARHGGREIDRSDGFFLLFEQPEAAARFALDYHAALAALKMQARAAVHVGAVTLRANAAEDVARGAKPIEVEGLSKPLAARIMGLATGGRTLLSMAAAQALRGCTCASHGHYRLKGLAEPVELLELLPAGQAAGAPPADTEKAYRVLRDGELWIPVREVRHNLPAERDAFVGRAAELRALAERLADGARLVTLCGTGGTGKTRLARRFGRSWLGDWPGGVWFCDLSEARSAEGICFAVAAVLGVPLTGGDVVQRLAHAIAARGRCLLILDNFEQVAGHASATLGAWLDATPQAAFVVTSRERLHLAGETVLPVEPLAIADEAIALFELRARAQQPGFAIDAGQRAAVAEVVRLLDGLPLAIELAAARVRVLSPAQIVQRLRDRFALLAGARGAAARQATLRAAIDWSWQLLAPWEQAALAQCSVFEGGFTLEAAEAVLDLSSWPEAGPALDVVQALVDKSLLRSWVPEEAPRLDIAEPYFGMYISIHEFAAERLSEAGGAALLGAQQRHGRWYARAGNNAAMAALRQPGGMARLHALVRELDNLIAALRRAAGRGDGSTAAACFVAACAVLRPRGRAGATMTVELGRLVMSAPPAPAGLAVHAQVGLVLALHRIGLAQEARTLLERAHALAHDEHDDRLLGRVLDVMAFLKHQAGQAEQARELQRRALDLFVAAGDRAMEGTALANLGSMHADLGHSDQAIACYREALAAHRQAGDQLAEGITLGSLGATCLDVGRLEEARSALETALALEREARHPFTVGITLGNLANLHELQGRLGAALACNEEALATMRDIGMRADEGLVLGQIGRILHAQGRDEQARERFESALAIHREVGDKHLEGATLTDLGEMLYDRGALAEADAMLAAGEALLRRSDHLPTLAQNLAARGCVLADLGNFEAARAALEEAQAAASGMHAGAGSSLERRLERLRALLPPAGDLPVRSRFDAD